MLKLSREKILLRFSIFAAALAVTLFVIGLALSHNDNKMATAAAGDRVSIDRTHIDSPDDKINYGHGNNSSGGINDGWTTRLYNVTTPSGNTIRAYCAEPRQNDPTDTTAVAGVYTGANANAIKLIMYMNLNNAYSSQISTYYSRLGVGNDNNLKYAWTHAIIGYLYRNNADRDGQSDSELAIVREIIAELNREVSANPASSTWRIAKNYTLYEGINNTSFHQNVVWLEGSVQRGSITVQKCDSLSRECQVEGINFGVYNNSGVTINDPNGNTYANGALIASGKTGADGKVTFSNLLVGFDYTVKELATGTTNTKYALTASNQNVSLTTTNKSPTLQFFNRRARGDIKFTKLDNNNNQPLANVLFSITPMYDDGTFGESHYVVSNQDGVVDTRSSFALHSNHTNGYDAMVEADETIIFQGFGTWFADKDYPNAAIDDTAGALPIGKYLIEEMRCASNRFCYEIKDQKKIVEITNEAELIDLGNWNNACAVFNLETTATDAADSDQIVEATKDAKIKDTISYCVKKDTDFALKGILMDKATGEPLLIDEKPIEASLVLNSAEECGTVEMYFDLDASELGGKEIVVFETLYYNGVPIASHEDINDESQTVYVFKLKTIATDANTGNKVLPITDSAKIKDEVHYCLIPNIEYTIKAVLMDKTTKNGVLINSEPVEQTLTFTPKEACGSIDMHYDLNTSDLAGAKLVFFESLYVDDELLVEHKDFNNEDESFEVELPAPDTGAMTNSSNRSTESNNIIMISAAGVLVIMTGYVVSRISSRRKFFGQK